MWTVPFCQILLRRLSARRLARAQTDVSRGRSATVSRSAAVGYAHCVRARWL